jgi:hypothetical protein
MSKHDFTNLLAVHPRVKADGTIVYGDFVANDMWFEEGHKVRPWQPRDPKTREAIGPMGFATILGTENGKMIARGFEALDLQDPQGQLDIVTTNMRNRYVNFGEYAVDGDGRPLLIPVAADAKYFYVKLTTGLVQTPVTFTDPESNKPRDRLWTEHDMTELLRRRIEVSEHGFHTLGGSDTIRDNVADSELTNDETKVMWMKASRSKIFGTKIPECRWSLVRIARNGGEGAILDTGVALRLKGAGDKLEFIDARGDAVVVDHWRRAEQARLDLHRAKLAANRLARQAQRDAAKAASQLAESAEIVDEVALAGQRTEEVTAETV